MAAEFDAVLKAPFGALGVRTEGDAVAEIRFLPPGTPAFKPQTALAARACQQLSSYLADPQAGFDLPLKAVVGDDGEVFYTDDLKEAVDRSNEWAQLLARTYVETHITDLDREPVRRTFQITATFEIVAETAEEAEEMWAGNGPEVGPGITMDSLTTWTEIADDEQDRSAR